MVVQQKLRTFVVPGCYPYVEILPGEVEVGQAPVDDPQLLVLPIEQHVLRLDIPMHDAVGMAIVQSFQQLSEEEAYLGVCEVIDFTFARVDKVEALNILRVTSAKVLQHESNMTASRWMILGWSKALSILISLRILATLTELQLEYLASTP